MTEQDETNSSANKFDLPFTAPEKQKARAILRERFLRVINGIIGKPVEFSLYENTQVSGEFRGCDIECSKVFVRNLKTPLGMIPEAILRTNDIICLDIDINIEGQEECEKQVNTAMSNVL
ncbi:gem-associated protein 7 [Solenopsis invicta]|uniref:gem-associated protein 7 n=1 Tax=Solenopsis invicta TaxID=13686 RepID=UPI0005963C32|nr:gem-associated protein 7 [Solenopsis invicta]